MSIKKSEYMSLPEHQKYENYLIAKKMLEEHRFVDVSAFVFCLKYLCRACWLLVCAELIANPPENVSVSSMYALREATGNDDLSILNVHYPGVEAKLTRELEKLSDIQAHEVKCRTYIQNTRAKEGVSG